MQQFFIQLGICWRFIYLLPFYCTMHLKAVSVLVLSVSLEVYLIKYRQAFMISFCHLCSFPPPFLRGSLDAPFIHLYVYLLELWNSSSNAAIRAAIVSRHASVKVTSVLALFVNFRGLFF